MAKEVADSGYWDALHDQPRGKGMPEVMEVEIHHACGRTGPVKGMPHIEMATALSIMKDPRHIWSGPESVEQGPERFIKRERAGCAVLGLFQSNKSMRHVDRLPREGQQLLLAHPRVQGREHDRLQEVLAGINESIRFRWSREVP